MEHLVKMGLAMTELVVDSWGHCVFCLEKIRTEDEANSDNPKPGEGQRPSTPSSSSVYCIQYLSRYLKLDMRKLFSGGNGKLTNKKELLDRVNKSKLKVELCQDCASLTGNLLELCRNLERIQMEVTSYLELVHGRVVKSGRRGKRKQLFSLTDGKKTMMGKSQILEGLRSEVKEKCSRKLQSATPRVNLQILVKKENKEAAIKTESDPACLKSGSSSDHSMVDPLLDLDADADYGGEDDDDQDEQVNLETGKAVLSGTGALQPFPVQSAPFKTKFRGPRHWDKWSIDPSTKQYKCNLCSKQFVKHNRLQRHYRQTHKEIQYRCFFCNVDFPTERSCTQHRKQVHSKSSQLASRHSCDDCGAGFRFSSALRDHQVADHPAEHRCRCPSCDKAFTHGFFLKLHHLRTQCGNGMEAAAAATVLAAAPVIQYTCHCDICGNGFTSAGCLKIHMDVQHEGYNWVPPQAPRVIRENITRLLGDRSRPPNQLGSRLHF